MDRIGRFTVDPRDPAACGVQAVALPRPAFGPAGGVNPTTPAGERLRGHTAEAHAHSRRPSFALQSWYFRAWKTSSKPRRASRPIPACRSISPPPFNCRANRRRRRRSLQGAPCHRRAPIHCRANRPRRSRPWPPLAADPLAKLKRARLEPTDFGFPINLATALRLSDARPLIVAAAQASVWVAEAQLTRAKVLWVPTLMFGADYIRHDGGGPDFNKGVMTAPSVNYFEAGGGLNVSNAGIFQFVNLTDAFFEPLVAQRVLDSRQWDIQTAKNDALLLTADTYFRVHQYRGMYTGALYCVERGRDLVEQIASLSDELVSRVEVERARNLLAELEQQATSARQAWRVQSANLTRVLRLNPRAVVVPLEHDHLQLTLIDPAQPLADLQKIALTNRPELASKRALVQAAAERIRREKLRPLLPIVIIGGFQSPGGMLIQGGRLRLGPQQQPQSVDRP